MGLEDIGVSISTDGSTSFDAAKIGTTMNSSAVSGLGSAAIAAANGDTDAAQKALYATAVEAMAAIPVAGWIVAGAMKLFEMLPIPRSTTTNFKDWNAIWGPYDVGPKGSFTEYANTILKGLWDKGNADGSIQTLWDGNTVLGAGLTQVIKNWNAVHVAPQYTYRIPHTNGASPGGKGFQSGVPGAHDPIAVAANAIAMAAKAPVDKDFTFVINTIPLKITSPHLTGAMLQAKPALQVRKLPLKMLGKPPPLPAHMVPAPLKKKSRVWTMLAGVAVGAAAGGPVGAAMGAVVGWFGPDVAVPLGKSASALLHGKKVTFTRKTS